MSEQKHIFIRWFSLWVILKVICVDCWINSEMWKSAVKIFTFHTLLKDSRESVVYSYREPSGIWRSFKIYFKKNFVENLFRMKVKFVYPVAKKLHYQEISPRKRVWRIKIVASIPTDICRMFIIIPRKCMSLWRCNFNQLAIRLRPSLTSNYQYYSLQWSYAEHNGLCMKAAWT